MHDGPQRLRWPTDQTLQRPVPGATVGVDHIHVGDVAEMISEIVDRGLTGVINAATGKTTSFLDIAEKIREKHPAQIDFVERTGPPPHNGYRSFTVEKARALFPNLIPLGLDEYVSMQAQTK